jgi:predicted metal-dependent phosphoesterase TrpH
MGPVRNALPESDAGGTFRRPGKRIDLHCHSTYSDERIKYLPGYVFHPIMTPGEIYDLAKSRGMDFVTITDHDTIDGCKALLDERGPLDDFVFGEEITTAFPEDGTIVHVNVFDHTEVQHAEIARLRDNIYDLVHYLRSIDKLFVLNHLTWTAQHRVLKPWQIEAMVRMFDVFEGLNGARSYAHNAFAWRATEGRGKVLVAGSDSHTVRVGTTYTLSAGNTIAELLTNIRAGVATMCGSFGTAEKLSEDVWLVFQANLQRTIEREHKAWKRFGCRLVEQAAKAICPLACLGYHKRQNVLIRGFNSALVAC